MERNCPENKYSGCIQFVRINVHVQIFLPIILCLCVHVSTDLQYFKTYIFNVGCDEKNNLLKVAWLVTEPALNPDMWLATDCLKHMACIDKEMKFREVK